MKTSGRQKNQKQSYDVDPQYAGLYGGPGES